MDVTELIEGIAGLGALLAICFLGVWFGIKRVRKNHYYHGHRRFYRANVTDVTSFTYTVYTQHRWVGLRYENHLEERTGYNVHVAWTEKDGSLHTAVIETKDHFLASCCELSKKARIAVIRGSYGKRLRDADRFAPKPYVLNSTLRRKPASKPIIEEWPEPIPRPAPKPFVLDDRKDREAHPDHFHHTAEEETLLRRALGEERAAHMFEAEDSLNTFMRLHPPEEIKQKHEALRQKQRNDYALHEQFDEEIVMFRSRYHGHSLYTVFYVLIILVPALAMPMMVLIPSILRLLGYI